MRRWGLQTGSGASFLILSLTWSSVTFGFVVAMSAGCPLAYYCRNRRPSRLSVGVTAIATAIGAQLLVLAAWKVLEVLGQVMWVTAVFFVFIPALACAALSAIVANLVFTKQLNAAACSMCDYDLTGNLSGRCPECGTPVSRTADSE